MRGLTDPNKLITCTDVRKFNLLIHIRVRELYFMSGANNDLSEELVIHGST